MTPRPERETDLWKDVSPVIVVGFGAMYEVAGVDAARAAEAAQHQQAIAEKDAHLGRMLSNRYDADVVELRAELAAKDETIRQQAEQIAALTAERDRLKAALSAAAFALDLAGFRRDRDAAMAALTPQKSTDGETR